MVGGWYAHSDGVGRIDLLTNGWIVEHETVGDMLVGTIESTRSDVTLLADDALASILDATGDADADVIGTRLTMTANGTIGTTADHLEIRSSNLGRGWVDALAPHGILLDQTTGDLVLRLVRATDAGIATGDVALTALDGSIVNEVDDATVRVVGVSIDLVAVGGHIGSADGSADIRIDTATTGRLLAEGDDGVFLTEATGPLALLLAASSAGRVRITVPFAGGTDADLTLLPTGASVDGSRTIATGGADAAGTVELRAGNDILAPLGTLIRGRQVIVRTAFGQNPAAPVGTTAYFGGELTATDAAPYIDVFGGYARDEVTFFETRIDGHTTVHGSASAATSGNDGDDLVTITRITILPGTHLGTAGDAFDGLALPNSLRVDGQNGSNHVEVTLWGILDTDHHETRIEVVGTGDDPLAINTLTVNAADGDDVVLLRAVTLIPGLPARRPAVVAVASGDTTAEQVHYDRSVNGKLTVNGLGGDDTFVFDDTSSPSTVNGGGGDDTFLVGQFYANPRTAPYVDPSDAFETTPTNLGNVSNGVSRPAVLYGQAGDDRFVVASNLAELRLEAGTGDDEFVFITSTVTDTSGPTPVTVPLGQGFVSIDAGTGHSTLVVQVADPGSVSIAPVLQDVLWWTVSGFGLALDLYGFTQQPLLVGPTPVAQPYGLPGETDVRAMFRALAGDITPPYVFLGRGGDGLVVITETGNWTNVSPQGPLTDSYTVRLSRAATATVYITFTSAYGAGTPFAEFSIDGGVTWLLRAVLAIAAGDLTEHTVLVRWASSAARLTDLAPGASVMTISHTVSSADPDFDGTDVRNVYVNLFKDAFLEPTGDVPGLANTGAEPFAPALLALLLLLLGGAALLLGRRRRIRP